MKKIIGYVFLVSLFILSSGPVRADMIDLVNVNDYVKLSVNISGYSGGPFLILKPYYFG